MKADDTALRAAIASRLRKAREARGLSAGELARKARMAPGNYYLLESGAGNPTMVTLLKITSALEVDPGDLLQGLRSPSIRA